MVQLINVKFIIKFPADLNPNIETDNKFCHQSTRTPNFSLKMFGEIYCFSGI